MKRGRNGLERKGKLKLGHLWIYGSLHIVGMEEAPQEMKGAMRSKELTTGGAKNGKEGLDAMEKFRRTGRKKK